MALLQSGKIFYIKIGMEDYKDEKGSYPSNSVQYYNWFIKQFSEALAITDPDYNSIKIADPNTEYTSYYFLLPYINKDTEDKLALRFIYDYSNQKWGLEIVKQIVDNNSFYSGNDFTISTPHWNINNYFICKTENGIESGSIEKYFIEEGKYITFIVDTRYLNSHGFYTIGAVSSANKILEAYVTPNIFICDTINKFYGWHTDGIFHLKAFGKNYYPNILGSSYTTVLFDDPSIGALLADYYGGTGFYPQVFTNDESSFSVVKIHFGEFRPVKDVYLTKTTTSALADFCYYKNMLEEKNSWKEIEKIDFFRNKRKFLLGLNSINNNIDLTSSNNWVPVIETKTEKVPDNEYCLKFSSNRGFVLSISEPHWEGIVEYSIDEGNRWAIWNGEELSGDENQNIYLRGTGNTIITGFNYYPYWTFTGKAIEGNIETLLDYKQVKNKKHPKMGEYCFYYWCYNFHNLQTPPELPAIELTKGCYGDMFEGTLLNKAPKLPATKLAESCYGMMFAQTNLEETPELPATELAERCYDGMFYNCKKLSKVTELPATKLAKECYEFMFIKCYNLQKPPALPATELAEECYAYMFDSCKKLDTLPKLPATKLAERCYEGMFYYCSLIKLSKTKTSKYKYEYKIPYNGETEAYYSESSYYDEMFDGTASSGFRLNKTYYVENEPV